MSPEAKLDAILATLADVMGRLDAQDGALLEIREMLLAEYIAELADMEPAGSA